MMLCAQILCHLRRSQQYLEKIYCIVANEVEVQINIEIFLFIVVYHMNFFIHRRISYDAVTSKLTLIRVLHGISVDRPFQAIYQDEQLAPNLKLNSQNSQNLHLFKF